jgi:RNA polymerase sigma factor (TIGR02999 family)
LEGFAFKNTGAKAAWKCSSRSCDTLTNSILSMSSDITHMLAAWRNGDASALEKLTPLVYNELHNLARAYLSRERPGHMLQPTALVNEAFLRLLEWQPDQWESRTHFFAVAASLMRRILVQGARERNAAKRGSGQYALSLSDIDTAAEEAPVDLLALDESLTQLEALDPRQARVVELRYFAGLTMEETAEVLQVSLMTVRRDWRVARAWLHQQLST